MQPLTLAGLAANAYRTLGISASMDQAAIQATARRMRVWPDARRIPPTPWDLPALGELLRSRQQIEQATALLSEPQTRLQERLLWYHGSQPPAAELPLQVGPDLDSTAPVDEQHNGAVAALHAAAMNHGSDDLTHWQQALRRFNRLSSSPEYLAWLVQAEQMGNFDKRASAAEIEEAARSLPGIIVAALAPRLKSALDQQDEARSAEILSLLNASGSSTEAAGVVDDLLGSLEDTLDTHCRRMEADLRERLATNHDSPHTFYVRNREASEDAEAFYKASIAPILEKIRAIAANRLGVIARAQGQCSQALTLLALGWEWTARFMQAEKALQAALELADGLAARSKIQRELDRMRPLAEQQRQWKNPLVPPKPKARPAQASGAGGSRAWVFVAIALVSGVARLITQSTTPTSPTPSVPLYDSQSINSIIKSIPVPSNGSGERPPDFVTLPHGETTLMGETNREP